MSEMPERIRKAIESVGLTSPTAADTFESYFVSLSDEDRRKIGVPDRYGQSSTGSWERPPDHDERMAAMMARAEADLGNSLWAPMLFAVYESPLDEMEGGG